MKQVDSSTIHSVGHDPIRNVLTVRFNGGAIYEYDGVTDQLHQELMNAPSIGRNPRP